MSRELKQQVLETHVSEILTVESVTHNVRRFVVSKPDGYYFQPGQATEVSLDKDGWRDRKRPFTFTSLVQDANLEFTIKLYPERDGVTDELGDLTGGDRLILRKPFGAISYRGSGTFIAGGAGVTPFIAILRQMEADACTGKNELRQTSLLFSNKTAEDIILRGEFTRMLGDGAVFTLTDVKEDDYEHGRITREMIQKYAAGFDQPFYLCGPPSMVTDLSNVLKELGVEADQLIIEE